MRNIIPALLTIAVLGTALAVANNAWGQSRFPPYIPQDCTVATLGTAACVQQVFGSVAVITDGNPADAPNRCQGGGGGTQQVTCANYVSGWDEWAVGGGGGATTFLGLTDTPSTYVDQSGLTAVVNPAENGIDFEAISGGSFEYSYRFSSSTSCTPTSGDVEMDNVDPTLATLLCINEVADNNDSPQLALSSISRLDWVGLLDRSSEAAFVFRATADSVLVGDVWTIPVTEIISSPIGSFTNNERLYVAIVFATVKQFIALTDTPNSYVGQAGNFAAVNGTEDGLEFLPGGGGGTPPCNVTIEVPRAGQLATCGKALAQVDWTRLVCTATGLSVPTDLVLAAVECDAGGGACAGSGAVTLNALETSVEDLTFSDPTVELDDWYGLQVISLTASPEAVHCQIEVTP